MELDFQGGEDQEGLGKTEKPSSTCASDAPTGTLSSFSASAATSPPMCKLQIIVKQPQNCSDHLLLISLLLPPPDIHCRLSGLTIAFYLIS